MTDEGPMQPAVRVWVGGHNLDAKRVLGAFLAGCIRPSAGPIEAAFIAAIDEDEALYFAAKVRARLVPGGQLWLVNQPATSAASALLALGYRENGMRLSAEGLALVGFTLQSPTT